jgi:hypothetical protein
MAFHPSLSVDKLPQLQLCHDMSIGAKLDLFASGAIALVGYRDTNVQAARATLFRSSARTAEPGPGRRAGVQRVVYR